MSKRKLVITAVLAGASQSEVARRYDVSQGWVSRGIGRTHAGTHVLLLVHDLDVQVINAATGEILRELTIDLARDYQPRGTRPQT